MPWTIRRLEIKGIAAMQELRLEALGTHPLAFASSIDDDVTLDPAFVERSIRSPATAAIFGAVENDQWAGMVGVYRHEGLNGNHRAQLWGMYVTPALRRKGVVQLQLCVTAAAGDAQKLYESAGFRVWGCEPRALQWEGRFVDEYHLILPLIPAVAD